MGHLLPTHRLFLRGPCWAPEGNQKEPSPLHAQKQGLTIRLATPFRLKETTVYLSPLLPKQGKASSAQTTEGVPAKGGQAGSLPEARDRPSPTVGFRCTHVDSQGQRMGPELAQNPSGFLGAGRGLPPAPRGSPTIPQHRCSEWGTCSVQGRVHLPRGMRGTEHAATPLEEAMPGFKQKINSNSASQQITSLSCFLICPTEVAFFSRF